MASSEDLVRDLQFILDNTEEETLSFINSLGITTQSATATAEASAGKGLGQGMDMDDCFFYNNGMGEIPQSLDELVDLLDIKASYETTGSHDIQHFSTFASEDKWPI